MQKAILSSLLFLSLLPLSMTTSAIIHPQSSMPPCSVNPVQGCIGAMPSGSATQSPQYTRPVGTYLGANTGKFIVSQPNGTQSWEYIASATIPASYDNHIRIEGKPQNYDARQRRNPQPIGNFSCKDDTCHTFNLYATCGTAVKGDFSQTGDEKFLTFATGKTEQQSVSKAMMQCQANSLGNCQVIKTQCPTGFYYKGVSPY